MWTVIYYLIIAIISSVVLKVVCGFVFGLPLRQLKGNRGFHDLFLAHSKKALSLGVFQHATTGIVFAVWVYVVGNWFITQYNGNHWLYFSLSILWTLFLLGGTMIDAFFCCCTGGYLVLTWFGPYTLLAYWAAMNVIFMWLYIRRINSIPIVESHGD